MSTEKEADDQEPPETEHDLGGTPATLAGIEVFAEPERGRFVVDQIDPSDGDGGMVDVHLRSDAINGRVVLQPAQARALADRLLTTAAEVEASN
jgi:hypothetical protein